MYTSNCADYYGCLLWPKSSVLEGHTVIVHKRMLRDQKQAKNLLVLVVFVYIVFLWHVFEDVYVTSIHGFYSVDDVDCTYT